MHLHLLELEQHNRITNHHYLTRLMKLLRYCVSHPDVSGVKHHILPKNKSWFPEYAKSKENLVLVSTRVHFLIHHLMWKAFPKDAAMYTAFWNMSHLNKDTKLTTKQYEKIRLLHSIRMKTNNPAKQPGAMDCNLGDNNPAKRPEVRAKISKASKERMNLPENVEKARQLGKLNKGKHAGELNPSKRPEVRTKISLALSGKPKSELHKIKMSIATKNAFATCQYCGIRTSAGNIARWHNHKCKLRPQHS